MSTTLWPMRVIRNHYHCPECDQQWFCELTTVGDDWCISCGLLCAPYASEAHIEFVSQDEEELL